MYLSRDEAETILEIINGQIQCDLDFIGCNGPESDDQMKLNVKCWRSIRRKILKRLKASRVNKKH